MPMSISSTEVIENEIDALEDQITAGEEEIEKLKNGTGDADELAEAMVKARSRNEILEVRLADAEKRLAAAKVEQLAPLIEKQKQVVACAVEAVKEVREEVFDDLVETWGREAAERLVAPALEKFSESKMGFSSWPKERRESFFLKSTPELAAAADLNDAKRRLQDLEVEKRQNEQVLAGSGR